MKAPLSRGAWRCLKALKSYDFQRRGWACPSHATLAKDLRVDLRSIRRYVAELAAKNYLKKSRRPNTSSVYNIGPRSGQNVRLVRTEIVLTDVLTDVLTINTSLTPLSNTPRNPSQEVRTVEPKPPERTPEERKLLTLARRWCDRYTPEALWPLQGWIIAQQLYDAGALSLPPDAAWSEWPQIAGLPPRLQASKTSPIRKPAAQAQALVDLKRKVEG